MLTYGQFCQEHREKYAGLSSAEKKKRYADYERTQAPNASTSMQPNSQSRTVNSVFPKGSAGRAGNSRESGGLSRVEAANASKSLIPGYQLSKQTQDYLCSLGDPFNLAMNDVGYPAGADAPTRKVHLFARGTGQAGTAGCFAALFSPLAASSNQAGCIQVTESGYAAPNQFPQNNEAQTRTFTSNSPYDAGAEVSGDIMVRIVCAGLRVRYTGKVVDRAGLAFCVTDQDGHDLNGLTSDRIATEKYRSTTVHSVTDEATNYSCLWSPTLPNEPVITAEAGTIQQDLANASSYWIRLRDVNTFFDYNLGILVIGADPGAPFYVEGFVHLEYVGDGNDAPQGIGNDIQLNATPAYYDPDGIALADNSNKNVTMNKMKKSEDGGLSADSLLNFVANGAQSVSSIVNSVSQNMDFGGIVSKMAEIPSAPTAILSEAEEMAALAVDHALPSVANLASPILEMSEIAPLGESIMSALPEVAELAPLALAML